MIERAYLPLRAVTNGLFHPRALHRSVVVLRAYFDDSGTHSGSKIIAWAGFMATDEEWSIFEKDWAALIDREKLETFHMADLENGTGQCDLWPRGRRDAVIHDFRQVICKRDVIGIGSVVRVDDWQQVVPAGSWLEQRLISPVYLAFEHCIQQALHWAQRRAEAGNAPEKVSFFFDLREREAARGLDIAGAYDAASPWASWFSGASFGRMRDTLPLQAADMLAYETYRLEVDRHRVGGSVEPRAHLRAMLQNIAIHGQYYDKEALSILAHQITDNEPLDLMRPQGSDHSQGWLTMVEKEKLFHAIEKLDETTILDWANRATTSLKNNDRVRAMNAVEEAIREYKEQYSRAKLPKKKAHD